MRNGKEDEIGTFLQIARNLFGSAVFRVGLSPRVDGSRGSESPRVDGLRGQIPPGGRLSARCLAKGGSLIYDHQW